MTYGDGLSNVNIKSVTAFHQQHGRLATVTGINLTARFGELKIEGDQVLSFREKPKNGEGYINGGFMVLNRGIFVFLSSDDNRDLEYGPMERLAEEKKLMVYKHNGFWACMDTLRDMEYLNKLWQENKAEWKVW